MDSSLRLRARSATKRSRLAKCVYRWSVRLDDQIIISTPEGVDVEITLAGLGSRAIAGLLDLTIEVAVLAALFLVFGFTVGGNAATGAGNAAFAFQISSYLNAAGVLLCTLDQRRKAAGRCAARLAAQRVASATFVGAENEEYPHRGK